MKKQFSVVGTGPGLKSTCSPRPRARSRRQTCSSAPNVCSLPAEAPQRHGLALSLPSSRASSGREAGSGWRSSSPATPVCSAFKGPSGNTLRRMTTVVIPGTSSFQLACAGPDYLGGRSDRLGAWEGYERVGPRRIGAGGCHLHRREHTPRQVAARSAAAGRGGNRRCVVAQNVGERGNGRMDGRCRAGDSGHNVASRDSA